MISPLDSRYANSLPIANKCFSDDELIICKICVEFDYLIYLIDNKLLNFDIDQKQRHIIADIRHNIRIIFDKELLEEIEKKTKHDIVAIIEYVKYLLRKDDIDERIMEYVHIGLTSQDIVSVSYNVALKNFVNSDIWKHVISIFEKLICGDNKIPFIGRTHGQLAIPTDFVEQFFIFEDRTRKYIALIKSTEIFAKFGGVLNDMRSLRVTNKNINWKYYFDHFVIKCGLKRTQSATQIDNYESLCLISDYMSAICSILINLCRDMWMYYSYGYFKLNETKDYAGSSAMPVKINPIDIENAEGNLEISRMWFNFLSDKLRISRLQRDLTDSTVMRNVGIPFAHFEIAINNILKGISKISINKDFCEKELEDNYQILSEPVQTILKYEGFPNSYDIIKDKFKGIKMTRFDYISAIESLNVNDDVKHKLKNLSPVGYL